MGRLYVDEALNRRAPAESRMQDAESRQYFSPPVPRSPFGHRLMFMLLALLSFAVYAPTVVLPIIREHCELLAEEARIDREVQGLRKEVARGEEMLDAFKHDSEVIERLAQIDLNYQRPNEETLSVTPTRTFPAPDPATAGLDEPTGTLLLPHDWPEWALAAQRWGDDRGITRLFIDARLRVVLLLMAGGLLVAAFVLFAPMARPGDVEQVQRRTA